MTRQEFDAWIEAHYTDLLKVAKRRARGDEEAADTLHAAVISALGRLDDLRAVDDTEPRPGTLSAWVYMTGALRFTARNSRRAAGRRNVVKDEQKKIDRAGPLHGRGKRVPKKWDLTHE